MKMRLVVELEYPGAETEDDEREVKGALSEAMLKLAREDGFEVLRKGRDSFKVSEVMVGCAKIAELPAVGDSDA